MKWKSWAWILLAIVLGLPLILIVAGILTGLLLPPVAPGVLRKVEPAHAENTAFNLKNAITAFHTEYHDYPLLAPAKDITIDSGHALMDILLGAKPHKVPDGRNPQGIAFYTDRAANRMGGGRYRKGLTYHPDDGTGALWDPWGNHYRVRLDTDSDKQIENPEAPGTFLPETIAVWSAGPDGDFDTWKDNVKSW